MNVKEDLRREKGQNLNFSAMIYFDILMQKQFLGVGTFGNVKMIVIFGISRKNALDCVVFRRKMKSFF